MPPAKRGLPSIFLKRAYDQAAPEDGYRVLVDRLWPRGCSKATLKLDVWARDLAPSAELRKWFGHDPERWALFQQRYRGELHGEEQQRRMRDLLEEAGSRPVTLVYGAKDEEHHHAIVLQQALAVLLNDRV